MLARALAHERMLERMALARVSGAASASAAARPVDARARRRPTGRKARRRARPRRLDAGLAPPNLGRRVDVEIVAVVPVRAPAAAAASPACASPCRKSQRCTGPRVHEPRGGARRLVSSG